MKIGIYPGSFNPWHAGHKDILEKALQVFDYVYIAVLNNENKDSAIEDDRRKIIRESVGKNIKVQVYVSPMTLQQFVGAICSANPNIETISIIRGLRNGNDLQYEMNNQYWNEDIGLKIPFVYFITDRNLAHVSSTAIRNVNKLGLKHKY